MIGKAFCGNGIIHLNIAEIHEDNIGGQKKRAPIGKQGTKIGEFANRQEFGVKFVKISKLKGSRPLGKIERPGLGNLDSRPTILRLDSLTLQLVSRGL